MVALIDLLSLSKGHHPAAEQVDDGSDIEPALGRPDIGEV
jgi:hypothetical protein